LVLRGRDEGKKGAIRVASDAGVLYRADRSELRLTGGKAGKIAFTGRWNGATVVKTISLTGNSYLVEAGIEIEGAPAQFSELAVEWNLPARDAAAGPEVLFDSVATFKAGKVERDKLAKLTDGKLLEGGIQWAGYNGKYFLAALIPMEPQDNHLRVWLKQEANGERRVQVFLPPGRFGMHLKMYLGPKELKILEKAGNDLKRAVDLGWFTFVALPLLRALDLSHHVTGNYGIDIILLTVLIKILFYPLTQKSFQSMREMQKLQPQMAKIREQYKDDPQRMNKETMELYRRHKVNPLGGCLPMLLQTPILFGLYRALLSAVELRHAPFFGWINDLSAPDRLGSFPIPLVQPPGIPVLTLLMGASMLAQQWMTPATGDKSQQKMMMLMPVVFTFMFLKFPAGLTLYWLVNNVLTVAQQVAMKRRGVL